MSLDDGVDNAESEAGSAASTRPRRINPVETLEDPQSMISGHARAAYLTISVAVSVALFARSDVTS